MHTVAMQKLTAMRHASLTVRSNHVIARLAKNRTVKANV
jgi:hypothetical protein